MTYRQPETAMPLITFFAGTLVALDAERGTKVWQQLIGPSSLFVSRVVVAAQSVFVVTRLHDANQSRILLFDYQSGAPRGAIDTDFRVDTALANGDRVYFGGTRGILALRADRLVLFRASAERTSKSAWNGDSFDVVMKDASGRESWRLVDVGISSTDGLFVLGDVSAQPDLS